MARIQIADLPEIQHLTLEEMELLFGAGRFRPSFETLEDRQLMAASLTASLNAGVLRIEGTSGADRVYVEQSTRTNNVYVGTQVNGEDLGVFPGSGISRIEFYGLAGNDYINLDFYNSVIGEQNTTKIAARLFGDAGNDTLVGGSAADLIFGGDGNDSLYGQAGSDIIFGEGDADTVYPGTGADYLSAGYGTTFSSVPTEDYDLEAGASASSIANMGQRLWQLDWPGFVAAFDRVSATRAGSILLTYSWTNLTASLNQMTAQRAGEIIWTYDWTNRITALKNMTAARASQVIWSYSWANLTDTLNHMTAQRAGEVIWNYSWANLTTALNQMTAARAGEVINTYSWANLTTALNNMTAARAGEVIWTYSWTNRITALNNMTAARASQVIWSYSWANLTDTLNHMTAQRAGEVIWNYSWANLTTALNQMTAARAGEVINTYSWANLTTALNNMTAIRAGEVIWTYSWTNRIAALNNMTAARAGEVIMSYDWDRITQTMKQLTGPRALEILQTYSTTNLIQVMDHLANRREDGRMWSDFTDGVIYWSGTSISYVPNGIFGSVNWTPQNLGNLMQAFSLSNMPVFVPVPIIFPISGTFRDKYFELAASGVFLGRVLSGEQTTDSQNARYQSFDGGILYSLNGQPVQATMYDTISAVALAQLDLSGVRRFGSTLYVGAIRDSGSVDAYVGTRLQYTRDTSIISSGPGLMVGENSTTITYTELEGITRVIFNGKSSDRFINANTNINVTVFLGNDSPISGQFWQKYQALQTGGISLGPSAGLAVGTDQGGSQEFQNGIIWSLADGSVLGVRGNVSTIQAQVINGGFQKLIQASNGPTYGLKSGTICRWDQGGNAWVGVSGGGFQDIAVDSQNRLYGLGDNGLLFQWPTGTWGNYTLVERFVDSIILNATGNYQGARYNAIGQKWHDLGGVSGPLGAPIDQTEDSGNGGTVQYFAGGYIYTNPTLGITASAKVYEQPGLSLGAYPGLTWHTVTNFAYEETIRPGFETAITMSPAIRASYVNDAYRPALVPGTENFVGGPIIYVNGAMTSYDKALAEATALGQKLARPVYLVYNGTSGEADFGECSKDYLWDVWLKQHNQTTQELAGFLLFLADHNRADFSIISHSQGNLIVNNALKTLRLFGDQYRNWYKNELKWTMTGSPLGKSAVADWPAVLQDLTENNPYDPIWGARGNFTHLNEATIAAHEFLITYLPQINLNHVWQWGMEDDDGNLITLPGVIFIEQPVRY